MSDSDSAAGGPPAGRPETHGFPLALTSFVGRAEELARLLRLLDTHRLVTLTGPGGVGKTRLATEATGRLPDRLARQVWLVDLAATSDPERVPAAVGSALGVQQRADRPMPQAVAGLLVRQHALLVLDNCEHVVDALAHFCHDLLSHSEDVRILATSREPLAVPGEARLRVGPLPVEGPTGGQGSEPAGVTLFVDRARLVDPTFEPTAEDALLLRRIAHRLDGVPLAIELAAARCESLGLAQLLDRLDEPLAVLTEQGRTGPPRHRSLRETVDWSYRLLSQPEQRVFRRVAIFAAPFTLPAAEAVAGAWTEPILLRLVDLSLLTPPVPAPDGSARYLMLQGLRAFGVERLTEAGERASAAAAMNAYYASRATSVAEGIRTSGGEAAAAAWFDAEDPLLHQALSFAIDGEAPGALPLATALAGWWQLRGRSLTGYRLLRQVLDAHPERDSAWFTAQVWLGRLAQSTARWDPALEHFGAVCDGLGTGVPSDGLVDGLAGRSGTLRNLGRVPEAIEDALRAVDISRHRDYAEGEALALTQLSLAAGYTGDDLTATRYADRAARIDRSRIPDRLARRVALVSAIARIESGDLIAAQRICVDGLTSARVAGDVPGQADFCSYTTRIALRTGEIDQAADHIRESLRLTGLSGDLLRVVGCLDDCAHLCLARNRWADALTLWAAHAAQSAAWNMPDSAWDDAGRRVAMREAAQHLDAGQVRDAERRGAAMTLDTATEFATLLAGPEPAPASGPQATLTPRERDVVALVARGRTDAQIAAELFISIRTVRSHLDRIRDKSGSRRRADLTRLALRAGAV